MQKQAVAFPVMLGLFAVCTTLAIYDAGQHRIGPGPPTPTVQAQDNAPVEPPTIMGVVYCESCHRSGGGQTTARDLCLLNEARIVMGPKDGSIDPHADKHSRAWDHIVPTEANPLAQSMQAALSGYEDISADQRCLSCHANWLHGAAKPPRFYELGVQCESCHGPASKWKEPHISPDWRTMSAADKAAMGMVDVRDPAARAKQCFSCHVGNPEEGKVVTHDMYAAGHPPLPSVEVETFASQMPRHWRYLPERGDFLHRDAFIKANHPDWPHDASLDLPRTKGVIVSGLAAMRSAVDLLTEEAKDSKAAWPELAVYDCDACHHELKRPSWRQQTGFGNHSPGRPPVPDWHRAIANVSIRHLAGENNDLFAAEIQKYRENYLAFEQAVTKQPFGDRQAIIQSGAALRASLDGLIDHTKRSRFDHAASQRALSNLLNSTDRDYSDFHSARQLAWAIKVLAIESAVQYPSGWPERPSEETRDQRIARENEEIAILEKWRQDVWDPRATEVEAAFDKAGLNELLQLKLPAGQAYQVSKFTPTALERLSAFDPAAFGAALQKLKAKLASE